jgi:hypothetical protein
MTPSSNKLMISVLSISLGGIAFRLLNLRLWPRNSALVDGGRIGPRIENEIKLKPKL